MIYSSHRVCNVLYLDDSFCVASAPPSLTNNVYDTPGGVILSVATDPSDTGEYFAGEVCPHNTQAAHTMTPCCHMLTRKIKPHAHMQDTHPHPNTHTPTHPHIHPHPRTQLSPPPLSQWRASKTYQDKLVTLWHLRVWHGSTPRQSTVGTLAHVLPPPPTH